MAKTKVLALTKTKWQAVVWFVGLVLVVGILPRFVHNQFVTGPIVNASLFIAVAVLGMGQAMLIGLVPSVVALSSGLLPLPLAPMVPFIMISNAVLVFTFSYFKKLNYWAGVVSSSLLKYIFLYATSIVVTQLIAQEKIATKAVSQMLAWPQLVTAVAGGIIAFGVLKASSRVNNWRGDL